VIPAGDRVQLDSLTSMRFVAAAMVLAHHAFSLLMPGSEAARLTDTGFVGVGFFFTLSGFILMWTFNPALPVSKFYGRRIARLTPLHYSTALVAAVYILFTTQTLPLWPSLANLGLIQAWIPIDGYGSSLNPVSWSLSCEAFFYLCFPYLARRALRWNLGLAAIGISVALVAVAAICLTWLPQYAAVQVLYQNPLYRMGGFTLGVLLAIAMKRGFAPRISLPVALALCGVAYVLALNAIPVAMSFGWPPARVYGDLIFLPAVLVLIAAAARADLNRGFGLFRHRWLVALGEASFALYMIHYLMLQIFVTLWGDPSARPGVYAVVGGFCVVAVVLSLVVYRWFERPAESKLRARIGTVSPR